MEPRIPAPTATEPAAAGDPAQVERVLADYHSIERFLGPLPAGTEPSEPDQKRLREYLGAATFTWYESSGWSTDTVRHTWLVRMAERAAREPPSTIRMPLYPNVGWGCEVPSIWVATGNFDPDVTFILPVGDTTLLRDCEACFEDFDRRDACIDRRCNLQVQGYFTGTITEPTEHCESIGYEFHVERATANGPSPSLFFLALPGGAAPPEGPPIAEGPRWGVLFSSDFRHQAKARERADALKARLVEKGHAGAQVLDSRRIPALWCCSFAVLVERFADERAAKALARVLKREGFEGALVRQLY
ncbi:MAG: SPOR domain-containing protein [Nannocystis sp.]|nr:SPOR domain-containing protein [Nannocystis sp.]